MPEADQDTCAALSRKWQPLLQRRLTDSQLSHLARFSAHAERARLSRIIARVLALRHLPPGEILAGLPGRCLQGTLGHAIAFSYSSHAAFCLITAGEAQALDAECEAESETLDARETMLGKILGVMPGQTGRLGILKLWLAFEVCCKLGREPSGLLQPGVIENIFEEGVRPCHTENMCLSFLRQQEHLFCIGSQGKPVHVEFHWHSAESLFSAADHDPF